MITKKTVTIKLTAHEANWLVGVLECVEREGKKMTADDKVKRDAYRAYSIIDRLESEGQTV